MRVVEFESTSESRVLADGLFFPECPRFVAGEIYVADGPTIRGIDVEGGTRTVGTSALPVPGDPTPRPDGLGRAADGTIWYADMFRGAAVKLGADGHPDVIVTTPRTHATSCLVYTHSGREWLAITATDNPPLPEFEHLRTGQLLALPLDALD